MTIRARRWELPGIDDLTKEQDAVLALPTNGRHLVIGGPGTGKTVVCLLRARRHAREGDDYTFLVWNHLLKRASESLFNGEFRANTWHSWFGTQFRVRFRKNPPKLLPSEGTTWRPIDWPEVRRLIGSLPEESGPGHLPLLVIDEGQDMPPDFYDSLNQLGFEHIFVAADQNQQINDQNSSLKELKDSLCVDGDDVIELTYNHRNRYSIARLARQFYTGDPASPPPDLPPRDDTIYTPRLHYMDEATMPRIARSILRHWDHNPRRLVGVIAPNNKVRRGYFDAIRSEASTLTLDNGTPEIQTFYGRHRPDVRFEQGGILVINAQACKGLEFDTVVLADIDQHLVAETDLDRTRKLFYVMVSRARRRVAMFMNRNGRSAIEAILPKDPRILRREDVAGRATHREEGR
ncbi:MAG: ATP-binding domain-containing protein [Gemmatimonadetes bacterium]|nr:ATP-binding domain-containing protein [Gemmatimonadota bacterium]